MFAVGVFFRIIVWKQIFAKKKCVAIGFFQVGDMMFFYREREREREYATANELTFSQIFRLSWFIANGQAYVLALRRSRSNFWAQVASPLDVQLMRDPLLMLSGRLHCVSLP